MAIMIAGMPYDQNSTPWLFSFLRPLNDLMLDHSANREVAENFTGE